MNAGEPLTPPDWPVWVQGEVLPCSEARWPLADVGLLFGRAVFTTVPWGAGRPLFWPRHRQRLLRDSAAFGLPLAESILKDALAHFAPLVPPAAGALRVHVSAAPEGMAAHLALLPRPVSIGTPPLLARAAAPWTAGDPLGAHKHVGRTARNLALGDARRRGADDVLLEDGRGGVIAASSSCLVVHIGDQVVAPGPAAGTLDGVARALLLAACRGEAGLPPGRDWIDRALTCEELERAEEIVLLGSVSGVRGARGLLGRPAALPGDAGPLARALGDHWRAIGERERAGGAEDP